MMKLVEFDSNEKGITSLKILKYDYELILVRGF